MATNNPNNNPDLLYLRSREDLLMYEDARMNGLLQAVADFYSTRNDQSIWGNFLRSLAIELAKLDYDYAYDLVTKDPSFLTPPDIRRRWAAPLYVSSNWPSAQQSDVAYKQMLVALIKAYKMGTTVEAIQEVIFAYTGINIKVVELYKQIGNGIVDQSDRNTLGVSVIVGGAGSNPLTTVTSLVQLQTIVQSLYNAIALAKPAHVGLEFTTVFGEAEDLDCILSPAVVTAQQLPQLTQEEQAFYTFTRYAPINPALFWKKLTPFPLGNVIRDSNGNFQLVTSVGSFPNLTGSTQPVWSTVSGSTTADGNLTETNISPAVVSTAVSGDVLTVVTSFPTALPVGATVKLINLSTSTFLNGQNLTVASVNSATFTANFTHASYATTPEASGTATFNLPSNVNSIQYSQLNSTWKSLYQKSYTNTNCQSNGITDTLRIFVKQIEAPPFGPMLIQAPVLDPKNPKTTIAAYGRKLSPQLSPAAWAALPSVFVDIKNGMSDGTNATYSYVATTQFLHEGEVLTIAGFSNAALNVTAQIKDVTNLAATINATSVLSNVVTIYAPNSFTSNMLVTFSGLTSASYLNGLSLVTQSASPTSFTVNFTHANYAKTPDSGNGEVSTFQIPNTTVVSLEVPSPVSNAGMLSPSLQSAYYFKSGAYVLGDPPIAVSGAGIGSSWVPSGSVFQGQIIVDSIGNQQLALNSGTSAASAPAWNLSRNSSTTDGSVVWRNVGRNTFSAPDTWIGILNFNVVVPQGTPQPFTGEVGNWDSLHQYGLVAPRLSSVWEISGNPQDESFIFGLY